MSAPESLLQSTAMALRNAYGGLTLAPLRGVVEPTDEAGAYAIQDINTRFWMTNGRKLVGRKIGLTAPAVQSQLGVDQPDFGALFEDMQIANGGLLDPGKCIQPKAEAEIAIVLAKDIPTAAPGLDEIAAATEYAIPAIEIVDSRIDDWKITFADTVADNGSSGFYVLGDARKPLDNLDLYSCGMVLEVNQSVASIGAGAACLGHPFNAVAWLASALARRGEFLKAGDLILTGALGPMVTLTPGDQIQVKIGGLGEVGFNYGEKS
ncbi:2-keto-4-pentenoate hydratase [Hyphomonas sp. KY3]|jgi:2-keto-4-pentenoate hydratase|uniref:2-keto-4-pentenoate hydratase n=1 Tax=Hyphomonas sp. KY3 TaxID=2016196 RepID=UPI001A8C85E0|nr:fumarylacetoacetate hydrolase family protein [Hyphomonas sp. KY3]QSR22060.1 2-keto-4-pentenoate hydratase [Hyphomonas sp. KY3]|tara:strand:+ start:10590 stop:11384 length:795 start_codon:yes stop_codon:yes gene_type:complete